MVRIGGIPEQEAGDGAAPHPGANDVRAIRSLLGMDDQAVVDRGVGGNDDGPCTHAHAVGLHAGARVRQAFDFVGVRAAVDSPAVPADGAGEASDVLEDVELALARKTQGGPVSKESMGTRSTSSTSGRPAACVATSSFSRDSESLRAR